MYLVFFFNSMRDIDEKERIRKELFKAKNTLEAYIYATRDKLYEDNFVAHSTETEREQLNTELSAASDWLDDEGEAATKVEYTDRLKKLSDIADKVFYRIAQEKSRPEAITACQMYFNYSRTATENITKAREVEEYEKENLLTKTDEVGTSPLPIHQHRQNANLNGT